MAAVPSQEHLWHILTAILEGRPSHTFTDSGDSKGLPQKELAHEINAGGKLIAELMTVQLQLQKDGLGAQSRGSFNNLFS